jgi:hypothetical protein
LKGRVAFLPAALLAGACTNLEPAPPYDRPTIHLMMPATGAEVPFDAPFVVGALAQAPPGVALIGAELVMTGAIQASRSLNANGAESMIEVALTVPSEGRLGADRLPLELTLTAIAKSGEATIVSAPASATISIVDKTAPKLEVELPVGLPPPPMFDRAYPAGTPFSVRVRATDPVSGITKLSIAAPPFAGGKREQTLPPAHEATLAIEIAPPANADIVLTVHAEDAAVAANTSETTVRVRVGEGGTDRLPPAIAFDAPAHAECAESVRVKATATDDATGVLELDLQGDGFESIAHGPDARHPNLLSTSATVAVGRDRPPGSILQFQASAVDVAGNRAAIETLALTVEDTIPPVLESVTPSANTIVPQSTWQVTLHGGELCGQIKEARATFVDARRVPQRSVVPLGSRRVDQFVSFPAPPSLCAFSTVTASVALVDLANLSSSTVSFRLSTRDREPPRVAIAAPQAGGVLPGETLDALVRASDASTPIRSATITVSALNLDLAVPPPAHIMFPSNDCSNLVERAIPIEIPVPTDVRFFAPAGSIRIDAEVSDSAGNRTTGSLTVAVVDRAPPEVAIVSPLDGAIVFAGDTIPVRVRASDRNHNVDFIALSVVGPALIGATGSTSATTSIGARASTVAFSLHVDANAPLGSPVRLSARARDTSLPFTERTQTIALSTCGPPSIAGVSPPAGPLRGGQTVRITGGGFIPGNTAFAIAQEPLTGVQVQSATIAIGTVAAGAHPPGPAMVSATNQCRVASATGSLAAGYRFASPPVARFMRPRPGGTARSGDALAVGFGALADGVRLDRLSAELGAGPPIARSVSSIGAALDGTLQVPQGASGSLALSGTATDELGQSSTASVSIAIAPPARVALAIALASEGARSTLATGESIGVSITAADSDGHARDVTLLSGLSSSDPNVVEPAGDRAIALRAGTATLTATLGAHTASIRVAVTDRALVFSGGPLMLSPVVPSGALSPAPAPLELFLLESGAARILPTSSVSLTVRSPAIAVLSSGSVSGAAEGDTWVDASFGTPLLVASLPVRVRSRLDVAAGERWFVASGAAFAGGTIAGVVRAAGPSTGGWRLEIAAGGSLAIEVTGALEAIGGPGSSRASGGEGGPAAGGGGAATVPGGAAGGSGEPPGAGAPDDRSSTPGGAGGGEMSSGGRGAPAAPSSAGAGGGGAAASMNGAGAGGDGGHAAADSAALGGVARSAGAGGAGGGGGRGGGGGGGGGARITIEAAQASVRIDGAIDASGGSGGAHAGASGTGGGGGGGGAIVIRAATLEGGGTLRAHGGPGGAVTVGASALGSGGAGGGGAILLELAGGEPPFLDADVAGGGTSPASGGAIPGAAGGAGAVAR